MSVVVGGPIVTPKRIRVILEGVARRGVKLRGWYRRHHCEFRSWNAFTVVTTAMCVNHRCRAGTSGGCARFRRSANRIESRRGAAGCSGNFGRPGFWPDAVEQRLGFRSSPRRRFHRERRQGVQKWWGKAGSLNRFGFFHTALGRICGTADGRGYLVCAAGRCARSRAILMLHRPESFDSILRCPLLIYRGGSSARSTNAAAHVSRH